MVWCLSTETLASPALSCHRENVKERANKATALSALSICQYNRHPVHLLNSFILSLSECTETMKQFCTQIEAIRSYVSERVRGKVCHLRLPARMACLYGRGGVAPHLSSPSPSTQQANTHSATQISIDHIQQAKYLTVYSNTLQKEENKMSKYEGNGLCSFTRYSKTAGDFVYYVLSTEGL